MRWLDVAVLALGACVAFAGALKLAQSSESTDVASRLSRTGDASEVFLLAGRTLIWVDVFRLASRRPFTGFGLRAGETVLRDFHNDQDPKSKWVALHSHNMYLEALLAGGYPAALAMLASVFFALRSTLAAFKRHGEGADRLCIAIVFMAAFMGMLTRGIMGVYFLLVVFLTCWLLSSHRSLMPKQMAHTQ